MPPDILGATLRARGGQISKSLARSNNDSSKGSGNDSFKGSGYDWHASKRAFGRASPGSPAIPRSRDGRPSGLSAQSQSWGALLGNKRGAQSGGQAPLRIRREGNPALCRWLVLSGRSFGRGQYISSLPRLVVPSRRNLAQSRQNTRPLPTLLELPSGFNGLWSKPARLRGR
jgi:hypothetical protein